MPFTYHGSKQNGRQFVTPFDVMQFTTMMTAAIFAAGPAAASIQHQNLHNAHLVQRAITYPPVQPPIANSQQFQGCYSKVGNATFNLVPGDKYSSAACMAKCTNNYSVAILQQSGCSCSNTFPPKDSFTKDNSKCDFGCTAYPLESCGGNNGYVIVWDLGKTPTPSYYDGSDDKKPESSASSSASDSANSSTGTAPGATVTYTTAPSDSSDNKSGGTNTVGIAVGVVVGIVGIAAIIGASLFFIRRRRNAQIEEEHRRNAAVNAFISGSKPPSAEGSLAMTDSRLDPVAVHRRLSDGSIADNQDYSRRILRVSLISNHFTSADITNCEFRSLTFKIAHAAI